MVSRTSTAADLVSSVRLGDHARPAAGCTCWTYHAISRKQAVLGLGMSWGCTTRMILTTRNRRPTRSRRMSRRLLLARLVLSPELVKSTSSSTHEEVTTNTSSLRSEKVALWTAQTQRGNCVSTRPSTLVGPRTAPFHLQADGQFHVQSSAQTNPRMPSAIRCKQTSSRSMTHKLDNKTGCPASLASGWDFRLTHSHKAGMADEGPRFRARSYFPGVPVMTIYTDTHSDPASTVKRTA